MDRFLLFLDDDGAIKVARTKAELTVVNAGFGPYDHIPTLDEIRQIEIAGCGLMPRREDFKVPITVVDEEATSRAEELRDIEAVMLWQGFGLEIISVLLAVCAAIGITGYFRGWWSSFTMMDAFITVLFIGGGIYYYRTKNPK